MMILSMMLWTVALCVYAQEYTSRPVRKAKAERSRRADLENDTLKLTDVYVLGKSQTQQLREGAFTISAVDIKSMANSVTNVAEVVNRLSGVKIRAEGGLGSDFDLSLNGMSGNSVRYFLDGVPLATKGNNVSLQNIPVNMVERVEVYKGVVPGHLGADALGGAINIITKKERRNFLDASVSAGSFHTYTAEVGGKYVLPGVDLVIHPNVSYNYSKNDYTMKKMRVWDEEEEMYVERDRKRFHDAYENVAVELELGFEKKKWTDAFYVSGSYTNTRKQLQTGSVQTQVYGRAERQAHAWNAQAKYRKRNFLIDGLTTNILLSHTWDNALTVDTAYRKYDWNGDWTLTSRNEITGRARQMRRYVRPLTVAHANFDYSVNEHHSVNLNYMLTRTGNKRTDELGEDDEFEPSNDVLAKHIFGLTYNQSLFGGRMANAFFLKDYVNYVHVEQNDLYWLTGTDGMAANTTRNNVGGGFGMRYTFLDPIALKVGYERSVRLPLAKELLGNGTTICPNLKLKPEHSHNVNVGAFGNAALGSDMSHLYYEATASYRKVSDYIYCVPSEALPQLPNGTYQYDNIRAVTMYGVEGEVKYDYGSWLQLSANCTYQQSLNMNRYKSDGKESAIYKNKIPNKPWLFANAEVTLTKHALFAKTDRLRFNYIYQYVHWFFLTWEGYGALETKSRIPTQNLHSASLTYSWLKERYNLTVECQNIFDCTAFDNYKLQKPGRAFMAKFRVFIN